MSPFLIFGNFVVWMFFVQLGSYNDCVVKTVVKWFSLCGTLSSGLMFVCVSVRDRERESRMDRKRALWVRVRDLERKRDGPVLVLA